MTNDQQALDVLHDPTRRHVLEMLREAGPVKVRPAGARRLYRIYPSGMDESDADS